MAEETKKVKEKSHHLWKDFKAFISRGSIVDMAVGVIMGSAFGAIVTALTNILLSVCTWGVPGGLNGLVTVLPALNDGQKGIADATGNIIVGQTFNASELESVAEAYSKAFPSDANAYSTIKSLYTLHGSVYTYNQSAVIDWGTFINAIIAFLIIALTLFIIVKVYNWSKAKRLEAEAKMKEDYYQKHPEERPVVAAPAPAAPTELDVLNEIKDLLKEQQKPAKKVSSKQAE